MIYSVDFLELAEKINPLAFVKYLKDTGWMLFQTKKSYVKIFQLELGKIIFIRLQFLWIRCCVITAKQCIKRSASVASRSRIKIH